MPDWQLIIVVLCLAAAAAWVVWRGVRLVRGRGTAGCGSACASCPQHDPAAAPQSGFVSLDQLTDSPSRKDSR